MPRQPLTLAEKNELRRFHASQPSGAAKQSEMLDWVRARFGKSIGRSSIGRILSSAIDVEETTMGPKRIRKRSSKYPDIEAALLAYILANRDTVVFTDDVLWDQARIAAAGRQVSMSWVQRFKNRNGLKARSRSLLSGGSVEGGGDDTSRATFIAALTMRRDELLASSTLMEKAKQDGADIEATEEDVESDEEVLAPVQQPQEQHQEEESLPVLPPVQQQPPVQVPVHQQEPPASVAAPEVPSLVTPTRKAQLPRSSPDNTSPRFAIVSQSTGRVELENRSVQQRPRNQKPPMPKSVAAAASPSPAKAATPQASSFRTPLTKRARVEEQAPEYEYGGGDAYEYDAGEQQRGSDQGTPARRSEQGTPSRFSEQGTPSRYSEQGTPSRRMPTALEEREIELRVEGLRTDNMLKRIKVAEENMLARKRLKDAGIAQEDIDAMLPMVRIQMN
ncbi:Ars-binding protein 1 [Globisporangium polare]